MRRPELFCKFEVVAYDIGGEALGGASQQGSDHRVRYCEYAIPPAVAASSMSGVHLTGGYGDNPAWARDVGGSLVSDPLGPFVNDRDHQAVMIVPGKLVVAQCAVQD